MTGLPTIERDCARCSLREGCSQVVWGVSQSGARLLVIGETPGEEEDLMGEPFMSREGIMLKRLLADAKISLAECAFTYAVKCKPGKSKVTDEVINTCRTWLWQEMKKVNPKVVVTLGKVPARLLLGLKKSFKLADVVGQFHTVSFMGAPIAPWYSPNHLLQRGREMDELTVQFFHTVWEKALV